MLRDGGSAHSRCLMNEGRLWRLGKESGFNMSAEGRGATVERRVGGGGGKVRDGVWQEGTVGHRQE